MYLAFYWKSTFDVFRYSAECSWPKYFLMQCTHSLSILIRYLKNYNLDGHFKLIVHSHNAFSSSYLLITCNIILIIWYGQLVGHQPSAVYLCVCECMYESVCPRTCRHIAQRMMNG